ncbi:MAG: PGF-pre-PGF domain-containing protein, partial [Candidatus Hadarchaeales archaeon]
VDVTSLNVSQLDFDSGASKLTFSIEAEIQSSKINASVMEELPLSITTNGSGSFPAGFESFTEATSFNAFLKAATTSASVVIQMNISGSSIQASLASEFPLRSDPMGLVTRSDNEVIINFGALKNYPSTFSLTASDKANVVLTVKAPPNAQAQGLPSGYETLDGAWVWRGQNAVSAISSLLRGDSNTVISYPISPATVIIQNIQEKVGQTIAVENNYIKNVVVESANTVAINFEKTHEIKKVRVSFASLAQAPQVTVQVLPEKPPEIQHPSDKKVHYYFTLEKPTSADITTASIEFKVSKIWITAQDVDSNTIKLLRYSNGWQELKTEKSGEDENYLYWTAELPGFSIFAVVALPTQATGQLPSLYIVIGAVVVVVIVLLAVIWKHTSRVPKE